MLVVDLLQTCRSERMAHMAHMAVPQLLEVCSTLWSMHMRHKSHMGHMSEVAVNVPTAGQHWELKDFVPTIPAIPSASEPIPRTAAASAPATKPLQYGNYRTYCQAAVATTVPKADPDAEPILQEDLPTFEELLHTEQLRLSGRLAGWDQATKQHARRLFQELRGSNSAKDKARRMYVNAELWPRAISSFCKFLGRGINPALQRELWRHNVYDPELEDILMGYFQQYVAHMYGEELTSYRKLVASVDMMQPHNWYPFARALERKIIYHAGPTNSGKTHNALEALKNAATGVYCGPLRLLAMEVYDRLNLEGIRCNLLTGQEKRLVPSAQHTACTVEMINFKQRLDVAVIDEIQLVGDEQRGWAWTRALLGLPVNEVHVCGDMSALDLVRSICNTLGEELVVHEYNRFTPLTLEEEHLSGYHKVQPGDCVVTFSRRRIYEIKAEIEEATGQTAAVVYGALPAETRRQQARLFNDPSNKFNVLVASDAIGMGLNLNIRRIVFDTVYKWSRQNTSEKELISHSLAKQIAGRAGRRSSNYPEGFVTCRSPRDRPFLDEVISMPNHMLQTPRAGLFPEYEQIEMVAGQLPSATFSEVIDHFTKSAMVDDDYFFSKQEGMQVLARVLDKIPNLSLEQRYTFCSAPVNIRDPACMAMLMEFATRYSRGHPVDLNMPVPSRPPVTAQELYNLELAHQVVSLWLWLSFRFEEGAFPGREHVVETQQRLLECMDQGLLALTRRSMKVSRGRLGRLKAASMEHKKANFTPTLITGAEDPLQFVNQTVRRFIKKAPRPFYIPLPAAGA